jgi:hypothetical protein
MQSGPVHRSCCFSATRGLPRPKSALPGADNLTDMSGTRRSGLLVSLVAAGAAVLGAVLALDRPVAAQPPAPRTVTVEANREGWTDTGIGLGRDDTARLVAAGVAGWGPGVQQGPTGAGAGTCALAVPDAPLGAVLARVGSGPIVVLAPTGEVRGPGFLQLLYNDCPGQYFDNSGRFEVTVTLVPAVAATAVPTAAPAPTTPPARDRSSGLPVLPLLSVILVVAAGVSLYLGRRRLWERLEPLVARGPVPRFPESARLESSAWLAPVRLRALQGERWPKRWLTIGGPDADVDFGLPGVWARLVPTADGGVRIETVPDGGKVLVDGLPLVLGQRLKDGARVFMGAREFTFRLEAGGAAITALRRTGNAALDKPDPRAAAVGGLPDERRSTL